VRRRVGGGRQLGLGRVRRLGHRSNSSADRSSIRHAAPRPRPRPTVAGPGQGVT
jgi:hypothetical protein